MSLKENLLRKIGTVGTVESSRCVSQIETSLTIKTPNGKNINVLIRDEHITDQGVPDGTRVTVVKIPGLKPRVIRLEEK